MNPLIHPRRIRVKKIGGRNLQVAGRRSQIAGQNLKHARTVNAKVILRKKKTVFTASRRPHTTKIHTLFKASGLIRNPIQDTKLRNCIPCLRLKTLKTIPCSAAHTHIGQIRECLTPPPPGPRECTFLVGIYAVVEHMQSVVE